MTCTTMDGGEHTVNIGRRLGDLEARCATAGCGFRASSFAPLSARGDVDVLEAQVRRDAEAHVTAAAAAAV